MKYPKDFLAAIKKAGTDPKEIRDPEAYMRAYLRTEQRYKDSGKKTNNEQTQMD